MKNAYQRDGNKSIAKQAPGIPTIIPHHLESLFRDALSNGRNKILGREYLEVALGLRHDLRNRP